MIARKAALVAVVLCFAACKDNADRPGQGKARPAPAAPAAGAPAAPSTSAAAGQAPADPNAASAAAGTAAGTPAANSPAANGVTGAAPASSGPTGAAAAPPGLPTASPAPTAPAGAAPAAAASLDGGAPGEGSAAAAAGSATVDGGVAAGLPPPPPPPPPGLSAARLAEIQAALQAAKVDAWLLTDFRRTDPIALRVLGLEGSEQIATRRWFYLLPARGQPQKLLHAIEPTLLDLTPGASSFYSSWRTRDRELGRLLRGLQKVAMDWSPRNDIPTASRVDSGTVELIRSMGPEIVSSAELIAQLESTLSPEAMAGQARAAQLLAADLDAAAAEAARRLTAGNPMSERELMDHVVQRLAAEGLTAPGGGIVSVDAHTAMPHYSPAREGSSVAGQNSVLLLDFSARLANDPRAIWADLTRVYFLGERTPDEVSRIAAVVFKARDAALELLRDRVQFGKAVTGAEVDNAARKVVEAAGYGERFLHRTGHSIDTHGHGDGVNNDDFETHDTRRHLPNTCFSVEPGIYVTGRFGIRSEIDVCLVKDAAGKLQVDVRGGPLQTAVPALLAK